MTEEQGSEGATSKEPFSASWPIWWVGDQRPKRFYLMHKSCDGDGDDDQVMESWIRDNGEHGKHGKHDPGPAQDWRTSSDVEP